ncbi:MAG TPA: hydroxysqualene dehydroxylase HpnE [Burkholderiaceae bacterium]|nr:hydroxysqualene dehydroxylase HpnE [Burkholderiaceae bacterium]
MTPAQQPTPRPCRRLAVVGAGWAGLAAAVQAVEAGWQVSLFEMAPQPGGRARSLVAREVPGLHGGWRPDNGQHILIGAYTATLALMRRVGADPHRLLWRGPLALVDARGEGLRLPAGPAIPAFLRAVWALKRWSAGDRLALLRHCSGWLLRGFRCESSTTVQQLTAALPEAVRRELIDPLCVAALNTPTDAASGAVFLRVLRDALFAGPGSSDLLIPQRPLAELLPEPALAWLQQRGARVQPGRRVGQLQPSSGDAGGASWAVDGEPFDAVVLACSAAEAARLSADISPDWSARAAAFSYEPILTAYLQAPGARLIAPMVALAEGPQAPAQFAFDHGQLGGPPGLLALVVSGAAGWVTRGQDAAAVALQQQAAQLLRASPQGGLAEPELLQLIAEKRATFRCVPGLDRPPSWICPGLVAAGDFVEGPYPATLEGAVRSGLAAVKAIE